MRHSGNHNCYSSQDGKWLWCLFGCLHCTCFLCEGWRACWIEATCRWDDCITGEWRSCLKACFVNLILHGANTRICATGWQSGSLFIEEGYILYFTFMAMESSFFGGKIMNNNCRSCHCDSNGWFIKLHIEFCLEKQLVKNNRNLLEHKLCSQQSVWYLRRLANKTLCLVRYK